MLFSNDGERGHDLQAISPARLTRATVAGSQPAKGAARAVHERPVDHASLDVGSAAGETANEERSDGMADETVVRQPGEGKAIWMLGGLYEVKAAGDETGGKLTVMEMTIPAGMG